ncbi:hypothetical protein EP232_05610 [bacterium]|nr:MAG: hypothetical protein EP232_05610 [bacterium]
MSERATSYTGHVRLVAARTLTLILIISGLLLVAGHKAWAKGAILGGTASLVNLLIMAGGIPDQLLAPSAKGNRKAAVRFACRMLIMAGALVYAGIDDGVAIGAAIPALFTAQAVLIVIEFTDKNKISE